MRVWALVLAFLLAAGAGEAQAQACRTVRFEPGATSATLRGHAPADGAVCYRFAARAGQTARIAATGENVIVSVIGVGDARESWSFRTEARTYEFRVGQLMRPVGPAPYTVTLSLAGGAPDPARAQGGMDVPVTVPRSDGQAAVCAFGRIVGLDPRGDGFLSVRSGPGGRPYREIDRLHNGQGVYICEQRGPWMAVVYPGQHPAPPHCDVQRASSAPRAYTGPCAHGWVHQRYVGDVAG